MNAEVVFILSVCQSVTEIEHTNCTCANNSHIETIKYLINKNYSIRILTHIKNCIRYCFMPVNFFWRSTYHKHCVKKKQKLPSTSI